ncbi:uncharacterized protein DUF3189 [Cytobacillus firmus]|uniref:Uncharacterized protein DUF3189 n=2 Tax=Cytobacillus TaxID=2675230 RepID=A0A366JJN0_CYTFI|nr:MULTISPECIES: DUF3189 family protein [Cytobacillus]RBP87603.1 uncharacterized protein DUF3189 [Cytobacillus firmus]TDX39429.1 uncharacterized protein DUF3189 [Cytobacillus oceanisediminis]
MIYIYHDFGGTHTTSLAAAYHLNILSESNTVPSKDEILDVPYFNKLKKKDAGKFIFHGEDDEGNQVYTLGRRSSKIAVKSLHNFCEMLNSNKLMEEKVVLSNTSPVVPFAMTLGGFFSRGLGVDVIGVPLLVNGAQKCCGNITQLVNETKRIAKESNKSIVNIENKEYQA